MPLFHNVLKPFRSISRRYGGHPLRLFTATLQGYFIFHLFTEFGFIVTPCWGASMLPTLEVLGDNVLISRYFRRGRGVVVGDIITFDSVVHPGERVIKRVLGLEGDYVMMDSPSSGSDRMVQVPEGHCWVVGDNLPYSRDSRHFGPVPMGLIKGKVIAKVLPWRERRWIANDIKPVEGN